MPTGDKKVNIFLNRLLDKTALRDQFLEFLNQKIDETIATIVSGGSGTLDVDKIGLSASANDTFDLDMSNANRVAVATGQVITLPENANRVIGEHRQVPFENASGSLYEVGIRYQSVEDGIAINARSGKPEYPSFLETIGEFGNPDSVVNDPGVKITLKIDGLLEAAVDHSGQLVRVFLTEPVSGVESIAYYDGLVAWVGGENVVEIPYSGGDGPLGQDTSVNPPSTTVGDYKVHVKGASWKKGASSIFGDDTYAFIGTVTGNGPAATPVGFSTTNQVSVFLFTLDKAYDGVGSGAGRTITADSGAVKIAAPAAGHGDPRGAALEVDMLAPSIPDGEIAQMILAGGAGLGTRKQAGLMSMVPMTHTTVLQKAETAGVSGGGAVLTLTRGGVDIQTANVIGGYEFVLLEGFATYSGLYRVNTVLGATNCSLQYLDGSTPAFTLVESGTATFVRPLLSTADRGFWTRFHNVHVHGHNEETSGAALTVYPHESAQSIATKDDTRASAILFQKNGTLEALRKVLCKPAVGNVGLELDQTTYDGDPSDANEDIFRMRDHRGELIQIIDKFGLWKRGKHFRDDFHYYDWNATANSPDEWSASASGSGSVAVWQNEGNQGGRVRLLNDKGGVNNQCTLAGPAFIDLYNWRGGFYIKFRREGTATPWYAQRWEEIKLSSTNFGFGLTYFQGENGDRWYSYDHDGNAISWPADFNRVDTGISAISGAWAEDAEGEMWVRVISDTQFEYWISGMTAPAVHTLSKFTLGSALGPLQDPWRFTFEQHNLSIVSSEWDSAYIHAVDLFTLGEIF